MTDKEKRRLQRYSDRLSAAGWDISIFNEREQHELVRLTRKYIAELDEIEIPSRNLIIAILDFIVSSKDRRGYAREPH